MNKAQRNKIEQTNRQIRHSEALAEESLLKPNYGAEMRSNEVKATINVHPHPTLLPFAFPFFLFPSRQPFSLPRKAFTLAEVLITLGIIGVVAAMTIPTLVNNYQKSQYVTGLKKAYTQFNQVLSQLSTDNGCVGDLKCTGLFDVGTTNKTLGDEIVKYFKVVKNCELATNAGCMSNPKNNYDGSGSAGNVRYDGDAGYKFITADGVSFDISNYSGGCSSNLSSYDTGNLTQSCGIIWFDINGPTKGPNCFGRDAFIFRISNGKGPLLYPAAGKDDSAAGWYKDANMCGTNVNGSYCAARIIEENWQMNY